MERDAKIELDAEIPRNSQLQFVWLAKEVFRNTHRTSSLIHVKDTKGRWVHIWREFLWCVSHPDPPRERGVRVPTPERGSTVKDFGKTNMRSYYQSHELRGTWWFGVWATAEECKQTEDGWSRVEGWRSCGHLLWTRWLERTCCGGQGDVSALKPEVSLWWVLWNYSRSQILINAWDMGFRWEHPRDSWVGGSPKNSQKNLVFIASPACAVPLPSLFHRKDPLMYPSSLQLQHRARVELNTPQLTALNAK